MKSKRRDFGHISVEIKKKSEIRFCLVLIIGIFLLSGNDNFFVEAKHRKDTHKDEISYKSKQVENGRVLYVFALGSRELIDCPIYSPGRRSSQKLKWMHNGDSLVQDSSIVQQINGTLRILMRENHQGTYQCIDENGGEFTSEKKSDEIILEKAYMGNFEIPNLGMSAKDLQKTVQPNHEVKLECSITGKPVPTIRWFKGGSNRKLKSANGFQIEDLESQNNTATSILTIPDPKSIHEANYHCMAYNLARKDGLHSRTYSLEVRQKPIIGHITCPRPQLSPEMSSRRQSTELEANVEADPSSHLRVVWLYQESSGAVKEINSTMFPKKYNIDLLSIDNSKRLKKASLKIKNLRLSDSGKYTIRAENKEGITIGPACDLDVQKPAEIEYPDDVNINEGEDAVFKCGGPGHHPFKITFDPNHSNPNHQNRPKKVIATIDVVKKNKPLEIGSDVRIIDGDSPDWSLRADSNSVLHLTINKVNWRNEGTYSCKIRNIDKKKERDLSGKLTIRKKFRIMDGLANNTVYLSDDRPLQQSRTCKVDNAKSITFEYVGTSNVEIDAALKSANKVPLPHEEPTYRYINFNSQHADSLLGTYRCIAVSSDGRDRDEQTFMVTKWQPIKSQRPDLNYDVKKLLRNVTVEIQEAIMISDKIGEKSLSLEFRSQPCNDYLSEFIVIISSQGGAQRKPTVIGCNHLGSYSKEIKLENENRNDNLVWSIAPVWSKARTRGPNGSNHHCLYTSEEECVSSIDTHRGGQVFGFLNGSNMMRPKVENVVAELRRGGELDIQWDYEPAKYRLQVVEFSIKINIKPQDKIGEFRVPYEFNDGTRTSKSHYKIKKRLDTLPSIEMDDLNSGNLYVEVRIRDSKYGLSEESHIHMNLDELNQNSFYEIMIAISIGLGIVILILLAGIIFCHFNRRKTKNVKNDDLPIPPGGKGLNDKTRPLNDLESIRQHSQISLIDDTNIEHLSFDPSESTSAVMSVIMNHSIYHHEATRAEQLRTYKRRSSNHKGRKRQKDYKDPYDAGSDASSERSQSLSSHSSDEISIGYQDEIVPFRSMDGNHHFNNDPLDGNRELAHPRDNRIEKPLAVVPPLPSLPWEMTSSRSKMTSSPGQSQKFKFNGQQKFIHT